MDNSKYPQNFQTPLFSKNLNLKYDHNQPSQMLHSARQRGLQTALKINTGRVMSYLITGIGIIQTRWDLRGL